MKYSFDTSALIVPYRHWPPPDRMPSLWDTLGTLIENKEIVATKEVYTEISQKDDGLLEWVRERQFMFIELDEEQQKIHRDIMKRFPNFIDPDLQKNDADPWVIALAIRYDLVVVSNERHGGDSNPRIPYVCKVYDVDHLSLKDEFLKEIDWQA